MWLCSLAMAATVRLTPIEPTETWVMVGAPPGGKASRELPVVGLNAELKARGEGWGVLLDINKDGVLADDEAIELRLVDGLWRAPWTWPDPRAGDVLPRVVGIVADPPESLGVARRTLFAEGQLSGVRIKRRVRWRSDALDVQVEIDFDGDGELVDVDRRAWVRPGDVVELDGRRWVVSTSATSMTVRFRPTSAPITAGVGAPAAELAGDDLNGQRIELADYRGRWLIIDFWGTWCHPCVAQRPAVEALAAAQGFALLGVANDRRDALERFIAEHGDVGAQIVDGDRSNCRESDVSPSFWPGARPGTRRHAARGVFALPGRTPVRSCRSSASRSISTEWRIEGWPTYALVDPDGRVVVLGPLSLVEDAIGKIAR